MSNNAEMIEDFKKLTEKYEAICNEQSWHPQHLKKLKWTIILIVHFLYYILTITQKCGTI